jgi:hypothetical protein
MKIIAPIILTVILFFSASAQTNPFRSTPPVPDSNTAAVRFERNVNTYQWNAGALYRYDDDDLFLDLGSKLTSVFIRSQYQSFRDEQNYSLSFSKRISSVFLAAGEMQSFALSDSQAFGSTKAGTHSGAIGVSYHPFSNISLTPLIGMRYDKQQFQEDDGLNYRLYGQADSLEVSGYRASFSGRLNESDLGSRKFKNNAAEMNIATEFSESSNDSVRVRWQINRNDFYVPSDSAVIKTYGTSMNIRSRIDQTYGVQNILSYDMGAGFSTQINAAVNSRNIENDFYYKTLPTRSNDEILFNTTVQEFQLEGAFDLRYQFETTFAMVGFQLDERDERHQIERYNSTDPLVISKQDERIKRELQLDNTAFRTTLRTMFQSALSPSDEISFSASTSLLQYDTPDTVNTDDRDELLINVSLSETHRFSSVFSAALRLEATLAHLVYLHREKSANNNWNRIIRLMPELIYRPSESFRMYNTFEVSANYTVFDFELLVPSVKSYSYRQVAFLDSTSYDMTKSVGIDLFAHVRVFERGEFRWQEFSERPQQRVEEVTFSPQLRYTFNGQWYFAVGFRSFAQKRFSYKNTVRQFENTFLSAGPTTSIVVRLSSSSLVEVRGWKEYQHQSGGPIQEFSNMSMNVRYYF